MSLQTSLVVIFAIFGLHHAAAQSLRGTYIAKKDVNSLANLQQPRVLGSAAGLTLPNELVIPLNWEQLNQVLSHRIGATGATAAPSRTTAKPRPIIVHPYYPPYAVPYYPPYYPYYPHPPFTTTVKPTESEGDETTTTTTTTPKPTTTEAPAANFLPPLGQVHPGPIPGTRWQLVYDGLVVGRTEKSLRTPTNVNRKRQ